jgi:hypothetical protein
MTTPSDNTSLPQPRRSRPWIVWLLCVVIFAAGVVSGYAIAIVIPPKIGPDGPATLGERRDRLVGRIDDHVDLDEQQVSQVRSIIEERLKDVEKIRRTIRPQMGQQAKTLDSQMREVLRPDQLRAWEAYFEKTFARFTESAKKAGRPDDEPVDE